MKKQKLQFQTLMGGMLEIAYYEPNPSTPKQIPIVGFSLWDKYCWVKSYGFFKI